jgi:SpoVK/Ycf46/Vps4 family AAA+-type ATPase
MSILLSIENIFLKAKKSKLNPILVKEDVNKLNRYLGKENKLNMIESICFATILCKNVENETADLFELALDFSISPISATSKLLPAIESLLDKGLILKIISKRRANEILKQKYYNVEPNILNAIISQHPIPKREVIEWKSSLDVLTEISLISRNLFDNSLKKQDVFETVNRLIEDEALKFPFIKWIKNESMLKDENLILFCHVIYKTLTGSTSTEFKEFSNILFNNRVGNILFIQQLINGDSPLIEKDLIKIHKTVFLEEMELQLTPKTIAALSEEKLIVANQEQYINKGLILPENISKQSLFYNEDVEEKINTIHKLLEPLKYGELMNRLKAKNMPQLLTVVLHGCPGSGKTELVKQLAVSSNRSIMQVDLANIRRSYYGESEKALKKVFSDYFDVVKSKKSTCPILLINEADGLLRNRATINSNSSSTNATEHTLQNILLESLENAQGIIIATTNLVSNLDPAFDRRFLYKLELNKPTLNVRSKIVKNKIKFLTEEESLELSQNYEVTGGQIANVLKKSEINFVMTGEIADYSMIQSYFEEEMSLQNKTRKKIGF